MTNTKNRDALKEGDEAARELADALKLAGITLPSLRGDFPVAGDLPLVQLGGASVELVRKLAAWIRQHSTRCTGCGELSNEAVSREGDVT